MTTLTPEQLSTDLKYEIRYKQICVNKVLADGSFLGTTSYTNGNLLTDTNGNPIQDVIDLRFKVEKLLLFMEAINDRTSALYQRECIARLKHGLDSLYDYPHIKPLVDKYLTPTYDMIGAKRLLDDLRRANYSPTMFGPKQYNGEELYISENCTCTKHPSDYFESEGIQYYMEYNLGDHRNQLLTFEPFKE